jgi:hypothetical protein
MKPRLSILIVLFFLSENLPLAAQGPSITTPTGKNNTTKKNTIDPASQPVNPFLKLNYPWQLHITVSVFWIGEQPTARNPTPNCASSWDRSWQKSYGGYDNPDPKHRTGYRPTAFTPKQNPFYIALPYNDCINHKLHKPEAKLLIPWFKRVNPKPGKTSCKGRWIKIVQNKKVCYAQWEDCGPFFTDDYNYVFRNQKPKNKQNKNAGLDISPAVRDYMGIKSGAKVHWRFIDFADVPKVGPWTQYGKNNPFLYPKQDPDYKAKIKYMKYLKKVRDNYRIHR